MSERNLILRRIEKDLIKMYIGLHVKCRLLLSDFSGSCILSTDFRKTHRISWKLVEWEPSYPMRMGGETDRHDDANSPFSQLHERA